jgi:protein TonB
MPYLMKNSNAGAKAKMLKTPVPGLSKPFHTVFLLGCLLTLQVAQVNALEITLANGDNLDLFGISIHQEQLNDIYVGALFASENTTTTNQILDPANSKRMSLKFISSYSSRKMARLWKQRIAMNNAKTDWRPMTKEIVQFAGIFKRAMQAGDELNIDFAPLSGTSVYLNRTLFLTIPNIDFYKLLLNVWIGSIPPTKAFKAGITGNNKGPLNEQLITHYESIQPEIGRFDADNIDKTLLAKADKPKPSTKSTTKKPSKSKKAAANKKTTQTNKTKPASKPKTKKESEKVVNQLRNDLEVPRIQVEVIKPKLKLDNLLKTDTGSAKKQQSAVKEKVAKKKPTPPTEKVAKLETPEETFFDADLISGSYSRELINSIRAVQSYPKKALAKGIQGEVTVQVKIDKNGELLENKIILRSGSRILDRAVLKMIRKAVPFPQIPNELKMNEFEFEVPLNFTLTE